MCKYGHTSENNICKNVPSILWSALSIEHVFIILNILHNQQDESIYLYSAEERELKQKSRLSCLQ